MAYAADSKSAARKGMRVRLPPPGPIKCPRLDLVADPGHSPVRAVMGQRAPQHSCHRSISRTFGNIADSTAPDSSVNPASGRPSGSLSPSDSPGIRAKGARAGHKAGSRAPSSSLRESHSTRRSTPVQASPSKYPSSSRLTSRLRCDRTPIPWSYMRRASIRPSTRRIRREIRRT